RAVQLGRDCWWARVAIKGGSGVLFASDDDASLWRERAPHLLAPGAELAEYVDELRGVYRAAAFVDGRLDGCLFLAPAENAPHWDAVKALLEAEALEPPQRPAGPPPA